MNPEKYEFCICLFPELFTFFTIISDGLINPKRSNRKLLSIFSWCCVYKSRSVVIVASNQNCNFTDTVFFCDLIDLRKAEVVILSFTYPFLLALLVRLNSRKMRLFLFGIIFTKTVAQLIPEK